MQPWALRLGETTSIISKPCMIKRYALLGSSDHLLHVKEAFGESEEGVEKSVESY